MPEATFVLCDCSSYLRNADFRSTRWQAMKGAVDLLCSRTTDSNVENSVGLISMNYKSSDIILNLTEDRRWNTALSKVELAHGRGAIEIDMAVRKARLALKHKRNSKQTRRIVVIISSPILTEHKALIKVAKDLKKNKISMDIICFGIKQEDQCDTVTKLKDMVKACNRNDNCSFLHVENEMQGSLKDHLQASPIIHGGAVNVQQAIPQSVAAAPGNAQGNDLNIPDASLQQTDPELWHALRLSIEMQRLEAQNRAAANEGNADNNNEAAAAQPETSAPATQNT
eukprot:UN30437